MENEIALFMARIIALIYIPMGVAMMTGQLKGKEVLSSYEKSAAFTLFVGIFAVVFGVFLVQNHNIWVMDWPVLITLLGWIAVIEGVIFIAFPKTMLSIVKRISKYEKVWGPFAIAFGLLFGYFGFLV
jgi:hypothetical protein